MATNVGDLYLNLKLDIKNLEKGIKKTEKQLGKISKSTKQTSKSFEVLNNNMVRSIRRMETLVVAAVGVYHAFDKIIYAGVKLNQQYEDQRLGIAALITAKTTMIDKNGKELSSAEQFIAVQGKMAGVMDDIKKAALETPASFQQMVGFYQQAIGHAITANGTFGKSIEQVSANTIEMTKGMSGLGAAMGMEMRKVDEEIRSIMSGNASTDSLLALVLFGSPKAANAAVKEAKKHTDGLSNLLLDLLKPFKNLESIDTYTKSLAQMGAAADEIRKESMKPLFEDIKKYSKDIKSYLIGNMDVFVKSWREAYYELVAFIKVSIPGFQTVWSTLDDIISSVFGIGEGLIHWNTYLAVFLKGLQYLAVGVNTIHSAFLQFGVASRAVGRAVGVLDPVATDKELKQLEAITRLKKSGATLSAYQLKLYTEITAKAATRKTEEGYVLAVEQKVAELRQKSLDANKKGLDQIYLELEAQKQKEKSLHKQKDISAEQRRIEASIAEWKAKNGGGGSDSADKDKSLAAAKRAALQLVGDEVGLLRAKAALEIAEMERAFAKQGIVANEYTMNSLLTEQAKQAAAIEWRAYELAVKKAGLHKKDATVQKKLIALKVKATKADTKYWKAANKNVLKFNKQMQNIGEGFADNLLGGDIKGAFKSLADDILNVFLDPMKKSFGELFGKTMTALFGKFYDTLVEDSIASTAVVVAQEGVKQTAGGITAGINALKDGDWYTSFARLAATVAVLAGLGVMIGGGGGGGGSTTPSPTPPGGYDSVSGGTYGNGGIVDYQGASISAEAYQKIVDIATINQVSFNEAVETYNDLQSEAADIWKEATTSLRKFGIELDNYGDAVNAVKSGSLDVLEEFFDNFYTDAEKIAASKNEAIALYALLGKDIPKSAAEARAGVEYWLKMYDEATDEVLKNTYLLNAAKEGEAANAYHEWTTSAQEAAQSNRDAAAELAQAASDLRKSVAGLKADWMDSVGGSKLILDVTKKETGIYGVNFENFLEKFTSASGAAGFNQEAFDKWAELSSALQGYNEALEEQLQLEKDKLNEELSFYENIKGLIDTAYTGALSYLNTLEKAKYSQDQAAQAIEAGDTEEYFKQLGSQLGYEKAMSRTKEEYAEKFNEYIENLKDTEYDEKTTEDVVEGLDTIAEKIDEMRDAIEKASHQTV